MNRENKLTVKTCYEDNKHELKLKLLNTKAGLKKPIGEYDLCRPGLLLSGFIKNFANKKIQIFGKTEVLYLSDLDIGRRIASFTRLMKANVPCLIISGNGKIEKELLKIADEAETSVFLSPSSTIQIYQVLFEYLNEKSAPFTTTHGTLVDV